MLPLTRRRRPYEDREVLQKPRRAFGEVDVYIVGFGRALAFYYEQKSGNGGD